MLGVQMVELAFVGRSMFSFGVLVGCAFNACRPHHHVQPDTWASKLVKETIDTWV